jgi:hypothetical protein
MDLPKDLEPYIVGLWRFREARRPRLWCATFVYRGHYYDVSGQPTLDGALARVRDDLATLRKRNARRTGKRR